MDRKNSKKDRIVKEKKSSARLPNSFLTRISDINCILKLGVAIFIVPGHRAFFL